MADISKAEKINTIPASWPAYTVNDIPENQQAIRNAITNAKEKIIYISVGNRIIIVVTEILTGVYCIYRSAVTMNDLRTVLINREMFEAMKRAAE